MTMESMTPPPTRRIGAAAYVIAGLSFIPMLGVPFGLASIIWGLASKRTGGRVVAAIGVGGLALTVALYGGLFYFGFMVRGGIYDELRVRMAQDNLDSAVKEVEFYRVAHGKYPDSIEELRASLDKASLDALRLDDPRVIGGSVTPHLFYYKKIDDDHYALGGVGLDGQPFSKGSLAPKVAPDAKLGLVPAPTP